MTFSFYHSLVTQPAEFDEAGADVPPDEVGALLARRRPGFG